MSKHIIIIEDDEELRSNMTMIIQLEGYRVTAFSSLTSIEELAELNASLFILDERLPYISGHIIAIMLHCNSVTRHIPQILISGSPMLANYAELAEVNGMLRKPFELAELLSMIRSFS